MRKPPYPAAAIANFFIDKKNKTNTDLTHLKLQKLLYYAQGWYMANFNERLFDEEIEAWRHGPVVRSIYRALSGSKNNQISNKINTVYGSVYGPQDIVESDKKTIEFLNEFWELFSPLHAYTLANSTHQPGTPWHKVYTGNSDIIGWGETIPDSLINEYFTAQKNNVKRSA